MKIIEMSLSDIKPYENNPRNNDKAIDAVAESIKQCEYISPIIVDENHVILAGHTRYKALTKLGYKNCQVCIKEGLTEEQKKKFRILDNKTNEFAEWDFEKLDEELSGLDFSGVDFGFETVDKNDTVDVKEVELKPYQKVHYLISCDIQNHDKIVDVISELEEMDGVEIESTLN